MSNRLCILLKLSIHIFIHSHTPFLSHSILYVGTYVNRLWFKLLWCETNRVIEHLPIYYFRCERQNFFFLTTIIICANSNQHYSMVLYFNVCTEKKIEMERNLNVCDFRKSFFSTIYLSVVLKLTSVVPSSMISFLFNRPNIW